MSKELRPEKKAVVRERYVALTGGVVSAIILNQLVYWQERIRDVDQYIAEERKRFQSVGDEPLIDVTHGWIYKTADQLSEETMLGLSRSNMRAHIGRLVEKGWVEERSNPLHKWDKTIQYRVNLVKLSADLEAIGYHLEGWILDAKVSAHRGSVSLHSSSISAHSSSEIEPQSHETELQDSETEQQYQRLPPEITAESTPLPPSTRPSRDARAREEEVGTGRGNHATPAPIAGSRQSPEARSSAPVAPPPGLARFVAAYPDHRRRVNDESLALAWEAAMRQTDERTILAALVAQKASWKWTNEPRFIPGIVRWLAEGRWMDPIEPPPNLRPGDPGFVYPPTPLGKWGVDY